MNLSLKDILSELENKDFYNIELADEISSTNDVLKAKAQQGGNEGTVLVALSQTKGRGRLGRKFFSPESTGLYMSVILKPDLKPEEAVLITTAAAVATAKAIEEVSDEKAQIKWVNDIYINGKKVCGILTEAGFDKTHEKLSYAVLGIGVNVFAPKGGFPEDIKNIAGAVLELPQNGVRAKLCAKILDKFYDFYKNLPGKNFVDEYISRSCVIGKSIKVLANGNETDAICMGIDKNCRLKVKYLNNEEELLSTGEISIKLNEVRK